MKKFFAIFSFLVLTSGCAINPQNPEQTVFQMRGTQNVVLRAAVEYKELKPCATPKVQPCSDKVVVTQLQLADKVTDTALSAAESAVRTPGFGKNIVDSAISAANAALVAFQTIVATIERK